MPEFANLEMALIGIAEQRGPTEGELSDEHRPEDTGGHAQGLRAP
jgi:hypothetical protein